MASGGFTCWVKWCSVCPEGSSLDVDGSVYHRSAPIRLAGTAVTATAAVVGSWGTDELEDFTMQLQGADSRALTAEDAVAVGRALVDLVESLTAGLARG